VPALVVNERWKYARRLRADLARVVHVERKCVARLGHAVPIRAALPFAPQANLASGGRGLEGILHHVHQHPAEQHGIGHQLCTGGSDPRPSGCAAGWSARPGTSRADRRATSRARPQPAGDAGYPARHPAGCAAAGFPRSSWPTKRLTRSRAWSCRSPLEWLSRCVQLDRAESVLRMSWKKTRSSAWRRFS